MAVLGPASRNPTVKEIVSSTLGVGLLTVLERTRSACCGVVVAEAVLFEVTGSNWSEWLIVAVFVDWLGLVTIAWITSVCGVPTLTVPTVQIPVPGTYVPWLGVVRHERHARGQEVGHLGIGGAHSGPLSVRVTV